MQDTLQPHAPATSNTPDSPEHPPTRDTLDELSAFGQHADAAEPVRALRDMVARNPVPAALAAAAAGAGLMALLALMARRDPEPRASMPVVTPLVSPRAIDYDALKQQIADLAQRVTRAAPVDAAVNVAKQSVESASDAIADGWATVREQALDMLGQFEPQANAAIKVARENPVWTALVVGAVGALLGSQLLGSQMAGGKPAAAGGPQSDPGADA